MRYDARLASQPPSLLLSKTTRRPLRVQLPRRTCRSPRCAAGHRPRPAAIARLKWQITRLSDTVQRFSTVLSPEQCFPSSRAVAVVSRVTICLPSRLSVASSSRQATRSTVQLLLVTADTIAEMQASADAPQAEAPLTPAEDLDDGDEEASSWRHRRAVQCESEASMVLRMLDLDTKADDENLGWCEASGQTVRQLKWHGSFGVNMPRSHRQRQKHRLKRPGPSPSWQQQPCVMRDGVRVRQRLSAGSLQTDAAFDGPSVGTTWDLTPSSDIFYISSLKPEALPTSKRCCCAAGGNPCLRTQDSAFYTCSSYLQTTPTPRVQAGGGAEADFVSVGDNSPTRQTFRRRCTAMTEKLRAALVTADVIPGRIRELLSEAVELVAAPGVPAGRQSTMSAAFHDCRVSVDTLNCVDLGDAARTWDLIASDTHQASSTAIASSMGDCRGTPVQQQQQQQPVELDQRVEAGENLGADTRQHHRRRQRRLFKLMHRRRKGNVSD